MTSTFQTSVPSPRPDSSGTVVKNAEVPSGEATVLSTEPFDPKDPPLPLEFFQTRYRLSRTTLWRYRRAGLRAIGVGAKTFIRESDLVRFLTQMAHPPGAAATTVQENSSHE